MKADTGKRLGLNGPEVPVSWGDLIDKITILEIKSARLQSENALLNVGKELSLLRAKAEQQLSTHPELNVLKDRLFAVNEILWFIEDEIRRKETLQQFDAEFIELARSVYKQNDRRFEIKREINRVLSSFIIEEKSYYEPGSRGGPECPN